MYINTIYALDESKYNVKNALGWGLCVGHLKEARKGSLGHRAVQLLWALGQAGPITGQIVSLAELTWVNHEKKKSRDPERS